MAFLVMESLVPTLIPAEEMPGPDRDQTATLMGSFGQNRGARVGSMLERYQIGG
jgi:hypothetical protein